MKGLGLFLRGLLDEFERAPPLGIDRVFVDKSYVDEAARRWPNLRQVVVSSNPAIVWEQWTLPHLAKGEGGAWLFTGRDRVAPSLAQRTVMYLFEVPDHRVAESRRNGAPLYAQLSGRYNLWNFSRVAQKVGAFITSSRWTRDDLIARYGVAPGAVEVVPPGIDECFLNGDGTAVAAARNRYTNGRRYVLHFSTGDPRDNTGTAFGAFSIACRRIPEDVVLLVGGVTPERMGEMRRMSEEYGIRNRVAILPFVGQEELSRLYRGAEAYLDPTLYEGFGFQIAEAMACGAPVLTTRVTSVPEVAGDAAVLLDPNDQEGFAEEISRLLRDPVLADRMRRKGIAGARRFTWKAASGRLKELLFCEDGQR
jgi:glycosyltransferase involved in cell wall biosynthesis